MRTCQKLFPCWMELVPAGSKTDPLLSKARRITELGRAPRSVQKKGEEMQQVLKQKFR